MRHFSALSCVLLGIATLAGPAHAQSDESPADSPAPDPATAPTPTRASAPTSTPVRGVALADEDLGNENLSPIDGVVGHLGFGYFTGSAPLGVRYWFTRNQAIDVGVDIAFTSGDAEAVRYGLEAGYVLALAHYHYSVVFTRVGLGFRGLDAFEEQVGSIYNVNGNAFLGAELFLGAFGFPNVSLQGGYGLELEYTNEGGSAFSVSAVDAGLDVTGVGEVGFHIYW
ncbi:MAG: hypothetical protein AAFP04_08365 [Myxococcota bacterium]